MEIFNKKNKMPQPPMPPTPVMGATQEDFSLGGQQPYPSQQVQPQAQAPQQQPQKSREQQIQEYDVQQFLANRIYAPENFAMSDIANLLWAIYRKLCDLERKQ